MPEVQQEDKASAKMKLLMRGMTNYVKFIQGESNSGFISDRAAYIAGLFKGYDDRFSEDKRLHPYYTQEKLEEIAISNYNANQQTITEEKNSRAMGFAFGYLNGYTL